MPAHWAHQAQTAHEGFFGDFLSAPLPTSRNERYSFAHVTALPIGVAFSGGYEIVVGFLVTWLVLAAFWFGLSGYTDGVHLTFGTCAVTLVAAVSHRYLTGRARLGTMVGRLLRMIAYGPWLLWQIVLANVDVLLRVLGLRSIDPCVIRIRPDLASEFGLVILANSITLTPGTVTVEIEDDGELVVHALSREAADAVMSRVMEQRVRWLEGRNARA